MKSFIVAGSVRRRSVETIRRSGTSSNVDDVGVDVERRRRSSNSVNNGLQHLGEANGGGDEGRRSRARPVQGRRLLDNDLDVGSGDEAQRERSERTIDSEASNVEALVDDELVVVRSSETIVYVHRDDDGGGRPRWRRTIVDDVERSAKKRSERIEVGE